MAYKSLDIARWLINQASSDVSNIDGEPLTNMKLQKLMYYVQGYFIALFRQPAFTDDKIEAWMYGPVVPGVYDYYSKYGHSALPAENSTLEMLVRERRLMMMVYNYYRNFSAVGLMRRTHSEAPWCESLPHGRGTVISESVMQNYFERQLPELLRSNAENALDELSQLPEGWDHYGTPAPSQRSIDNSKKIVNKVPFLKLLELTVNPSEVGGVTLNFGTDRHNIVGCNCGDDTFSWYIRKCGRRVSYQSYMQYSDIAINELTNAVSEL